MMIRVLFFKRLLASLRVQLRTVLHGHRINIDKRFYNYYYLEYDRLAAPRHVQELCTMKSAC